MLLLRLIVVATTIADCCCCGHTWQISDVAQESILCEMSLTCCRMNHRAVFLKMFLWRWLQACEFLWIASNKFIGSLPNVLEQMRAMHFLGVAQNSLSSTLPEGLSSMRGLRTVGSSATNPPKPPPPLTLYIYIYAAGIESGGKKGLSKIESWRALFVSGFYLVAFHTIFIVVLTSQNCIKDSGVSGLVHRDFCCQRAVN